MQSIPAGRLSPNDKFMLAGDKCTILSVVVEDATDNRAHITFQPVEEDWEGTINVPVWFMFDRA